MIKINSFRGDLTGILTKKEALVADGYDAVSPVARHFYKSVFDGLILSEASVDYACTNPIAL